MEKRLRPDATSGEARWPAELVPIDIGAAAEPHLLTEGPVVELYSVAGLAEIVDAQALLRATDPVEPPYWALVWIGARAIASRMYAAPPAPGLRVLDLGCGLGLCGLAAAAGGAHVTFADIAVHALELVRTSAAHHGLDERAFETLELDFTRDHPRTRYDVILAADIVYDPAAYEPLVGFLDAALRPGGTIWLTETLRADARRVLHRLAARGFACTTEAVWVHEDGRAERTWLHRLRR